MLIYSTQLSSAHKFHFLETRLVFDWDIIPVANYKTSDSVEASILAEKDNKYLECTDGIANSCNELRNSIDTSLVGKLAQINKKINKNYLHLDLSDAKIDATGKYIEVGNDVAYLLSDITDDLNATSPVAVIPPAQAYTSNPISLDFEIESPVIITSEKSTEKPVKPEGSVTPVQSVQKTETVPVVKKSIELKPEDITMDIFNHKDKIYSIITDNKTMIELYKKYLNIKRKSHTLSIDIVNIKTSQFIKSIPRKKAYANFSPNQEKLLNLMVEDLKNVVGNAFPNNSQQAPVVSDEPEISKEAPSSIKRYNDINIKFLKNRNVGRIYGKVLDLTNLFGTRSMQFWIGSATSSLDQISYQINRTKIAGFTDYEVLALKSMKEAIQNGIKNFDKSKLQMLSYIKKIAKDVSSNITFDTENNNLMYDNNILFGKIIHFPLDYDANALSFRIGNLKNVTYVNSKKNPQKFKLMIEEKIRIIKNEKTREFTDDGDLSQKTPENKKTIEDMKIFYNHKFNFYKKNLLNLDNESQAQVKQILSQIDALLKNPPANLQERLMLRIMKAELTVMSNGENVNFIYSDGVNDLTIKNSKVKGVISVADLFNVLKIDYKLNDSKQPNGRIIKNKKIREDTDVSALWKKKPEKRIMSKREAAVWNSLNFRSSENSSDNDVVSSESDSTCLPSSDLVTPTSSIDSDDYDDYDKYDNYDNNNYGVVGVDDSINDININVDIDNSTIGSGNNFGISVGN